MKKLFYILTIFMLSLMVMVPSSYASTYPSEYPELPLNNSQPYDGYLIVEKGGYTELYCFYGGTLTFKYETNRINVTSTSNTFDYRSYRLSDGNVWGYLAGSGVYSFNISPDNGIDSVIYSNQDIYDYYTNEVVFPQPPTALHLIIQEVTSEEIPKFQSKTVGTMKILTVCGIGLIALLVVLNLFGKVSRTFHLK